MSRFRHSGSLLCILCEIPCNYKPRIRNIYAISRIRGLYKGYVVEHTGFEPVTSTMRM